MPQEVVIIGAGKIGRGYMAQIFYEAGYQITFVDILPGLIEALNIDHGYEIYEVDTGICDIFHVKRVQAIHANDRDAVVQAIARVSLVVTSVGANNLPAVAENIAAAIQYRMVSGKNEPLNILIAENLMNGVQKFTAMVHALLSDQEINYMRRSIGVVGTVIGRTVPPPPPSFAGQSIANVIVEPHREFYAQKTDFIGIPPMISGIKLTDRYDAYVSRKLYVHNCTHAVMGYIGHLYGHRYSHEAMADKRVASVVWQAMEETALAVEIEFSFSKPDMKNYILDLFHRYQNEELWDTLARIGRDPIRKLQADDRLVGAARLIEKTGGTPHALLTGIAAALCFHEEDDQKSDTLQKMLQEQGIAKVLMQISSIDDSEPLGKGIVDTYRHLRQL